MLRSAVGYQVRPNVSVWLGYAQLYFYQPNQRIEYRPFQQLLITSSLPTWDFVNRTRLEERFLPGGLDVVFRFRHLARGFFPLTPDRKWAFIAQDELFLNLNTVAPGVRSGYDQNRAFIGFSVAASPTARVEFGYQYTHVRVPTAAPDRNLHTLFTVVNFNL